ncbi:hypothetical protein [Hymenobacter sp. BT491]|uniref:hypothetical protein n=1 Tax=Hymenobacter sp. BT491 TaxID=2766779 RepID=UPI001653E397|nr:hypothetical protein [Hymenobacter sp. BT491]MBC6992283.1 hypothetical protein [Hymenobacter sp. BT491]
MNTFWGEASYDYKVEDGYVFIGVPGMNLRYKTMGADTLVNDSNMGFEGTYVR